MGKKILFVDDEFSPDTASHFGSYMSYYEFALCEAGFQVQRVTGCDDALALVQRDKYDLAILDVMMAPGRSFMDQDTRNGLITGLFLARKIHEIDNLLPIFFLSNAGGDASLFEKVLGEGVVEKVLFKLEVTPSDLVNKVRERIGGS